MTGNERFKCCCGLCSHFSLGKWNSSKGFVDHYCNVLKKNVSIVGYACPNFERRVYAEKEEIKEELNDENQDLLTKKEDAEYELLYLKEKYEELFEENEQLKLVVKEVMELLSEEVDLFSDKAIEHDINAYIELKELDNKDAYYMATATKKAIKLLKRVVDD